jgi:hypothetical protein
MKAEAWNWFRAGSAKLTHVMVRWIRGDLCDNRVVRRVVGGGEYVWLVGLKPSPFVDRDREFVDRNRDSLEL